MKKILSLSILALFILCGCDYVDYYHIDRHVDYGWFTVIQHDTDKPTIINNLNKTLTIEIFIPDADFVKWYKVGRLVIDPKGSAIGVGYLQAKYIYYQFWVYENHKVDIRGDKGVVINAKVL
jgi:hypothetical protein